MLDKKTHLHTYERSETKRDIYRCIHPDCTHYQRAPLIIGKRVLCKCGNEFFADRNQLIVNNIRNLTCLQCSKSSKSKKIRETATKIEDILHELHLEESGV